MFHNVLAVEHTLRYQAYSSTPYVTKLFMNSAFVITLLILAFLNLIYNKLEVTVSRTVQKTFNISLKCLNLTRFLQDTDYYTSSCGRLSVLFLSSSSTNLTSSLRSRQSREGFN